VVFTYIDPTPQFPLGATLPVSGGTELVCPPFWALAIPAKLSIRKRRIQTCAPGIPALPM
jgi:hypothetical protein